MTLYINYTNQFNNTARDECTRINSFPQIFYLSNARKQSNRRNTLIVGHLEKYIKFIINTNIKIKNEMKKNYFFT